MSSFAARRLQQERSQFRTKRPFGYFARYMKKSDGSQDIFKWHCGIKTSDDGVWCGAVVELVMEFGEEFPARPPKVRVNLIMEFGEEFPARPPKVRVNLIMEMGEEFPARPPKVSLLKIANETPFHPNIYPSGAVCLSILNEDKDWRPSLDVIQILKGIQDLLQHPNPKSPAQELAYKSYIKKDDNQKEWKGKVKEQAELINSGKAYPKPEGEK